MKIQSTLLKNYLINIYGIICILLAIFIAAAKVTTTLVTTLLILCLAVLSLSDKTAAKLQHVTHSTSQVAIDLRDISINKHNQSSSTHSDIHHLNFREYYNLINYGDEIK